MKIGIISINLYTTVLNVACPLHSYAFQQFLLQHGIDNEIIDYLPGFYPPDFDGRYPLEYYKEHPVKNEKKQQELMEKWEALYEPRQERYDKIQEFIKTRLKVSEDRYSAKLLNTKDPGYDCYICATDVLWKYEKKSGFDPGFFLSGKMLNGKARIAYAASRGASVYTPKQEKTFLRYIRCFDSISVREKSLKNYINGICDIPVRQVLDPVFLHEKEFYLDLAKRPEKKGYVLLYLVMDKCYPLVEVAVRFAKEHGLEVIELSDCPEDAFIPEGTSHPVYYNTGVEDWLGYMADAEYIFTNSFHACCLSVILQKQFWAGPRKGDKIDSMLELFQLGSRRISVDEYPAEQFEERIDFQEVDRLRKQYKKESEEYILHAIDVERRKMPFRKMKGWLKRKLLKYKQW